MDFFIRHIHIMALFNMTWPANLTTHYYYLFNIEVTVDLEAGTDNNLTDADGDDSTGIFFVKICQC